MNYKYTEIMDYLRTEIDKDVYKDKLPSIRGLAIKFGCSNSTVIKAYNELESLSLVFSAPKSGYYINHNKRRGTNDYDFYSGVPNNRNLPLESLVKVQSQILDEKNRSLLNYSYPMGYNLLREHMLMDLHNPDIPLESVLITEGAQGAIDLLLGTDLLEKKVLVEDPTYNILLSYLEIKKVEYDTVNRDRTGIDMEAFESKAKSGEFQFFYTMSRNQNPLGTDLKEEDMEKIINLSREYDFYIIEDDYLLELSKGPTFFSLAPERTVYIRSFSKTVGPTFRTACVVAPVDIAKKLSYNITYLNGGAPLLNQAILLKYLKSDYYMKDMANLRDKVKQNIMIFKNAMQGFPFPYHLPETGFFASLYFPKDFKLKTLLEGLQVQGFRFRDITGFTRQEDKKVIRISLTRVEPNAMNTAVRELVKEVLLMKGDKDDKNRIYI
ncbi:PLP-dependent aminotransferase family protein [Proteiniclasticum sp.]|uniref:aminotransferase-like domain-containing protein n=1 Tax=Proteiniclasticum sp. TaxID=2053595 RepID=UPI002898E6F8|nr:PLP-dependent aminotransferase family protein [Proteiniclasticum sp.]